jgi:hypothetical protein
MQFMMAWLVGVLEILIPGRSRSSQNTPVAPAPDPEKPAGYRPPVLL